MVIFRSMVSTHLYNLTIMHAVTVSKYLVDHAALLNFPSQSGNRIAGNSVYPLLPLPLHMLWQTLLQKLCTCSFQLWKPPL